MSYGRLLCLRSTILFHLSSNPSPRYPPGLSIPTPRVLSCSIYTSTVCRLPNSNPIKFEIYHSRPRISPSNPRTKPGRGKTKERTSERGKNRFGAAVEIAPISPLPANARFCHYFTVLSIGPSTNFLGLDRSACIQILGRRRGAFF